MILTLFFALLALATIVCVLGYFTGDEPYLTVGLFFFFLLSILILNGQITYQTGEAKNTTYIYNSTDLSGTQETTAYTYTAWNDTTSTRIGWGLAIISFLGTALSLYNTRNRRMNTND